MIRLWRKNDGFTWVRYVPTQVLARRRARKERLEQAANDAKQVAREVARKSVAGIEHGVAQAGAAAAAGAIHAGHGMERGMRGMGSLLTACGRRLSQGLASAWRSVVALGPAGLLHVAGWLGGAAVVAAGARAAVYGVDRGGRLILGLGAALVVLASLPILWRTFAPGVARFALDAIKTQRAPNGAAGTSLTVARAGTLAVTAALAAAAVGGIGWSARWVYSAVMASTPPVVGAARAVGSQGVRIGEAEFRLAGIAAPDAEQTCGDGGRRWRCGEDARRALSRAVSGKTLTCHPRGEDEEGRRLAQCRDGKTDIAEELVKAGYVWADRDDTVGYRAMEESPKASKSGVWKAASTPPWIARERQWSDAQRAAPDGCPIKAETTGGEKIYHMPWHGTYQRVRIGKAELARGSKAWFCTEKEARAAGYKPATERR